MTNHSHPSSTKEVKALQKKFDVASSGRLFINVPGASLDLTGHDDDKVIIDVYVKSLSQNEALAIVERVKLRMRAIDNQTVRIESRSFYSDGFIGWNSDHSLDMRLVIKLPRSFNVDLQTAASDISINDVKGRMTVQGSGGTLEATNLKGKIEIYGYGCDININEVEGTKISIVAASGTLYMGNVKANQISVRASSCSSSISKLNGNTSLYLHGGSATVDEITGPLDVQSQSCEASVFVTRVEDINLSIRGGQLHLHIKRDAKARLLLEGNAIHLDESLSFQGEKDDYRIDGSLNSGRNLIHARAAAATIHCKSQN